jgi:hypothetical protein
MPYSFSYHSLLNALFRQLTLAKIVAIPTTRYS